MSQHPKLPEYQREVYHDAPSPITGEYLRENQLTAGKVAFCLQPEIDKILAYRTAGYFGVPYNKHTLRETDLTEGKGHFTKELFEILRGIFSGNAMKVTASVDYKEITFDWSEPKSEIARDDVPAAEEEEEKVDIPIVQTICTDCGITLHIALADGTAARCKDCVQHNNDILRKSFHALRENTEKRKEDVLVTDCGRDGQPWAPWSVPIGTSLFSGRTSFDSQFTPPPPPQVPEEAKKEGVVNCCECYAQIPFHTADPSVHASRVVIMCLDCSEKLRARAGAKE